MGYTPPANIDIGNEVINRASRSGTLTMMTFVDKCNPANLSGTIDTIEIWAETTMQNVKVATFFVVSGDNLSTRDTHDIGEVVAGSKQTFSGLDINVQAGDYIGLSLTTGYIERDTSGVGYWYNASLRVPCTNFLFTFLAARTISILGTGDTGEGELTIGDSFSIVDSLLHRISPSEAFSAVDSKVTKIVKALSEALSVIDSWVVRVHLAESLSIGDSLVKSATKQLAEAFSAVDSWAARLHLSEAFSVADSYKRFFFNLYKKVNKDTSTYTKINKDTSTYIKVNKADTGKGWFKRGWFLDWLQGFLYKKVNKDTSTYTKINKEISNYTVVKKE